MGRPRINYRGDFARPLDGEKPRTRNRTPEFDFQETVADFLRLALPPDTFWSSITHGVFLGGTTLQRKRRGARLRRMGQRPGVPDVHILYAGLAIYVELKVGGGLTKDQREAHRLIRASGGVVVTVRTLEALYEALSPYIPLRAKP